MQYSEIDRQKNINHIVVIVKLVSILFCITIIISQFMYRNNNLGDFKQISSNLLIYLIIFLLLIFAYSSWSFLYIKMWKSKHIKTILIIENFIYIAIFSTLVIFSKSSGGEFKFLFLFTIISTTIQLNKRHGMITALISAAIILIIDMTYTPFDQINIYFENDLILVFGFILVAWSLGQYVQIESESLNEKELQLKELENNLTEESQQRIYIEKMLLKNETCYNLLIRHSHDAIIIHRNNKLVFVNESAAKLFGYLDSNELNGKSLMDFIDCDNRDNLEKEYNGLYNKNNTLIFEDKITRKDGSNISVQNTSTYFLYEGKSTILTILRDITSEKQVQKLQRDVEENVQLLKETREYNILITEFFSNISHEFKTPLNIIFGSIQLLSLYSDGGGCKDQKKYLKIMKQNCYRLIRLINNLLDLTKLDSGFMKLNLKNANIVNVVEEITLSIVQYVESKGINLIFDTNIEEKIMAFDPDKIERIILNLLSNALKFTNVGGEIFVNIYDNKDEVIISVKDTGIGISEEHLEIIFDRFAQVDKTFRRNHEGTGIGLSLVKSFVEMHGGKIELKSKINLGSEFNITLPVILLENNDVVQKSICENIIERISVEFSDIYS